MTKSQVPSQVQTEATETTIPTNPTSGKLSYGVIAPRHVNGSKTLVPKERKPLTS